MKNKKKRIELLNSILFSHLFSMHKRINIDILYLLTNVIAIYWGNCDSSERHMKNHSLTTVLATVLFSFFFSFFSLFKKMFL